MCRQVTCPQCDRPGWAGCGAHVEQVLGHVHPDDRCRCSASGRAPSALTTWFRRGAAARRS